MNQLIVLIKVGQEFLRICSRFKKEVKKIHKYCELQGIVNKYRKYINLEFIEIRLKQYLNLQFFPKMEILPQIQKYIQDNYMKPLAKIIKQSTKQKNSVKKKFDNVYAKIKENISKTQSKIKYQKFQLIQPDWDWKIQDFKFDLIQVQSEVNSEQPDFDKDLNVKLPFEYGFCSNNQSIENTSHFQQQTPEQYHCYKPKFIQNQYFPYQYEFYYGYPSFQNYSFKNVHVNSKIVNFENMMIPNADCNNMKNNDDCFYKIYNNIDHTDNIDCANDLLKPKNQHESNPNYLWLNQKINLEQPLKFLNPNRKRFRHNQKQEKFVIDLNNSDYDW